MAITPAHGLRDPTEPQFPTRGRGESERQMIKVNGQCVWLRACRTGWQGPGLFRWFS